MKELSPRLEFEAFFYGFSEKASNSETIKQLEDKKIVKWRWDPLLFQCDSAIRGHQSRISA